MPSATQSPPAATTEPSDHVHDETHAHDTLPVATAPAPTAEPQATSAPIAPTPELAAYERAKPALEKYCVSCHTKGGSASSAKALEHLAMEGYPFGGHHAHEVGALVRKSLGASGTKATMPLGNPGAVKGDELAAILGWADAFDAAHPPAKKDPGKHHHGTHKH